MERQELSRSILDVAKEIQTTAGVSEPDIFFPCIYGSLARLACRDLPRLSSILIGENPEDVSTVLRDVGNSIEANRSTFGWLAPTLSSAAQSIMQPGGGPLLGAATELATRDVGAGGPVQDMTAKCHVALTAMISLARQSAVIGQS